MRQTISSLLDDRDCIFKRKGFTGQKFSNIQPFDVFKDDIRCLIRETVCPDDLHHVRMLRNLQERLVFSTKSLKDRPSIIGYKFEDTNNVTKSIKYLIGHGEPPRAAKTLLDDEASPQHRVSGEISEILW